MQGDTSTIFLDGCTLRTTDTGLRLTKGRLFLDNKVTLSSYYRKPETFANSLIFGNSTLGADYDLDVYVLGGARVETDGYVWDDAAA